MGLKIGKVALVAAVATNATFMSAPAMAQASNQELKQQIDSLRDQLEKLQKQLDQVSKQQPTAPAPAPMAQPAAGHEFLERKSGEGVTFFTRGGEVTIYGNLDLSLDDSTKGISGKTAANPPTTPVGKTGWLPDISTNLSYVGLRGFQTLGAFPADSSINSRRRSTSRPPRVSVRATAAPATPSRAA